MVLFSKRRSWDHPRKLQWLPRAERIVDTLPPEVLDPARSHSSSQVRAPPDVGLGFCPKIETS